LLLSAVSLLSGLPITSGNALLWGLCGFFAASLAPAAGLAPELPGMPAADLTARQLWWTFTVAATGLAILLLARKRSWPWLLAALALIALPHVVGAPQPASEESSVPAALAANFVGTSLAVSALFWAMLGLALGWLLPKTTPLEEGPA
jgi:cobalt transporter subunit CbtA